jgi:cold shock CspA family protein
MSKDETSDSPPTFTTTGRVKWFNNRAGYGFITVTEGEHSGVDVFVHHSAITVNNEQYRYLVQGEYVNFNMCGIENNTHKWQAGAVKGMHGGKLMCETRLESRESRNNYSNERPEASKPPTGENYQPRVRMRGSGPRDGDEWMLVRRRRVTQTDNRDQMRVRGGRPPTGGY